MRKLILVILVLVSLALAAAPALAQQRGTIVDVLSNDPDARFTTLVAALEAAGLVDTLSGEGAFTLFAPTNDAFDATLAEAGMTSAELMGNTDLLAQILNYHIVPERLFFRQLSGGRTLTTAQGEDVTVGLQDGLLMINDAVASDIDNLADNGIIQVIDGVLVPPSLVQSLQTTALQNAARVRIAQFSPDTPALDIFTDGELSDAQGLEFPAVTDWLSLPIGTHSIAGAPAGTPAGDAILGPFDLELEAGSWTTLVIVGSSENGTLAALPVIEDRTPIGEGSARLTVFHAIEGAPVVDVTSDGSLIITGLGYPGSLGDNDGAFTVEIPAGTRDLVITADGETLLELPDTDFQANTAYFVAAIGAPDAPDVVVLTTDMSAMPGAMEAAPEATPAS